jgi:hypothetical protein
MNQSKHTDNHESEQAFHTIDRMKEWRNKLKKFNDRKYEILDKIKIQVVTGPNR